MRYLKKIFWFFKALVANLVYGFPSKKLMVIGVTGTDGKTSTTSLIYHVLRELGQKASYISTVKAFVAGTSYDTGFHVTTPSPFFVQQKLKEAVAKNEKYFVLEVTSHAIDQLRTWGTQFKVAALTNITKEHLDYHKNFNLYAKTKMQLINNASTAVVNIEPDNFYQYQKLIKNKKIWTAGVNKKADYMYDELAKKGLRTDFVGFERENVTVAYAVARTLGFEDKAIVDALNSFERVTGRFDVFEKGKKRFLVDFAHTPNAYKKLFEAVKSDLKPKRIIHVFGCAGERDHNKRPAMGDISAKNADIMIVTEEDYRTEKLETIFKEIEKGIAKHKKHIFEKTYFFVDNRQEAVNLAVKLSRPGDLIMLTGKAHEKSLARGRQEYPWSEYTAIDTALT